MGEKSKLKKPSLAESKCAIWFGLFMFLGLLATAMPRAGSAIA